MNLYDVYIKPDCEFSMCVEGNSNAEARENAMKLFEEMSKEEILDKIKTVLYENGFNADVCWVESID